LLEHIHRAYQDETIATHRFQVSDQAFDVLAVGDRLTVCNPFLRWRRSTYKKKKKTILKFRNIIGTKTTIKTGLLRKYVPTNPEYPLVPWFLSSDHSA
jgi:hypothetical protein